MSAKTAGASFSVGTQITSDPRGLCSAQGTLSLSKRHATRVGGAG